MLNGQVHAIRTYGNFLKTCNYLRKLVYVCKLRTVVKTKKKELLLLLFFFWGIKERGIVWVNSSHIINKDLEG